MAVFTARAMNPEYRLKVISYPNKAADGIYYPQFKDTTGGHDFTHLNQIFAEEGQHQVQVRQDNLNLALEDEYDGGILHI